MVDPMDNPHDDAETGHLDDGLDLPPAMKAQLRGLYDAKPAVPIAWSQVDAAVLGEAREHFAPHAPRLVLWRIGRITAALATAAALGIVIWLGNSGNDSADQDAAQNNRSPMASKDAALPNKAVTLAGDVNGDGQLNILDAYLLQRRIDTALALDARWDLTRDGRIDASDVSEIAVQSVKLDGGPRL